MTKPSMTKINSIVGRGVKSLKKSLWDDPECYWPQEGKQNGLPERNLSLHVGSMFQHQGWNAYSEASYPKKTNQRLDLLVFRHGVLIACECKQLDMADRADAFAKDIKRLKDFRMTRSWDTKEWKAPNASVRYGLLLAVTWNLKIKEWWMCKGKHRYLPAKLSGPGWRTLGMELAKIDRTTKTVYGNLWLNRSDDKEEPDFWALYAIFRLPK
jgi:hypothetical protein